MTSSISGVGSISSAGIGSGLDVNSIVTQLMAVEKQPLTQLQSQASSLQAEVSTFGRLQSYFSALQDKSKALMASTLWTGTTASSADTGSVSVSTTATSTGAAAAAGSYAVNVQSLAGVQTISSAALASSSSTLDAGSLTITLGSWTGTPASGFTPNAASTPVVVTIGAADTSLSSIRDKINAAGAGVTASIVNDASGARLSIRSSSTGAANAFQITTTETTPAANPANGLAALAYDATVASSPMTRNETAVDAQATVNGISIRSASNTLTGVVDGLNIQLLKPTTSPVAVSVASDTASIKTAITNFVGAFNDLAGFLHTQTAYSPDSKTGGPLQGDSTALAMQSALRNVLNQSSSASSTWSRLSDIGITMKTDGTLDATSPKLDTALTNLPQLQSLLTTVGPDSASSGFVQRWKALADASLGSGGLFETRTAGLSASLRRNSQNQDDMNTQLSLTEARMRAQYTALDTQMSQLNGLSSYMTQQLAVFNKSTA